MITLLLTIAMLSACGLKGPLYMPEKPKPVVITPAAANVPAAADDAQSSSSASSSSSSSKAADAQ